MNNPESKFLGPDGNRCNLDTRGILQRDHVIAGRHRYCGKEFKRKLEHGPVDHEIDSKCKVYENGRVAADTSKTSPFDYAASKNDERRRIEVKGLTGGLGPIIVTAEVRSARDDETKTDLEDDRLTALQYRYMI